MQFKKAVNAKVEKCKNILIICEEHTRNKWYLENIYVLQEIAKEGDHPRAYEVAGDLIKNVGDVVDKLADLQDKMKKLKEVPGKTSMQVKNALFVGSTSQLQKMLSKKNKEKKNDTSK